MKKFAPLLLPVFALWVASTVGARAAPQDEFAQLENSPNSYWVPYPTPPPAPPVVYYGGPGPYYGPPRPVYYGPRFFIRFHFH
jgi:hypothetical protein